jgi:actin-like ATPase involved in cell morphogenesis
MIIQILETTQIWLNNDIAERGIFLTGEGASLRGLGKRLEFRTTIPVHVLV